MSEHDVNSIEPKKYKDKCKLYFKVKEINEKLFQTRVNFPMTIYIAEINSTKQIKISVITLYINFTMTNYGK